MVKKIISRKTYDTDTATRLHYREGHADLRHLRPECRAQIVEMIGLGAADLRKRGATELRISIDFPVVCADSVRATRESPRWVRTEPQAFPTWPGHRTRPKSSSSRSGHRRVAQRLATRRCVASNPASHESVVPRRFSDANCRYQTII